jgi:FkbM family methyltransferase
MAINQDMALLRHWRDVTSYHSEDEYMRFFSFCLRNIEGTKSQLFQDLFVLFHTQKKRNGFFVEFGAADGVLMSNTYLLEKYYGWTGIVAEPARPHKHSLRTNRQCIVENRCVWSNSNENLIFNEAPLTDHSTIEQFTDSDMHGEGRKAGTRYNVETISLTDLLDFHRAPRQIDYLSIDTEGSEFEILKAFDWRAYSFDVITVEHNHTEQRAKILDFLTTKGYQRKFEDVSEVDDWYVKDFST